MSTTQRALSATHGRYGCLKPGAWVSGYRLDSQPVIFRPVEAARLRWLRRIACVHECMHACMVVEGVCRIAAERAHAATSPPPPTHTQLLSDHPAR